MNASFMKLSILLAIAATSPLGDEPGTPPVPGKSLPDAQPPVVKPVASNSAMKPVAPDNPASKPIVPENPSKPTTELKLVFAYGSEKKGWIEEVTKTFNEAHHTLSDGQTIVVEPKPMGSGEIIERLLRPNGDPEQLRAHVVSPASAAFVTIGNGESRELTGKELIGETQDLVRSPLVLAMWADLADATRWQANPPTWAEVFAAVRDPERWKAATEGKAGIPLLKLGHTDPERSNSGLLTLILMVESASSAPKSFEGGLTRAAVRDPEVAAMLKATEAKVVKPLNASTGFLADSMLKEGPAGMGAALLYESLVIEKNRGSQGKPKLVAIYPKEGVFANEHPIGIVSRDWVTPAHADAAKDYIAFLLAHPQQEKAKAHGFRPSDSTVSVDDLIKPELGVSNRDTPLLTTPSSQMIREMRAVWQKIAASN